jgi:hypothetical protein
MKNGVLLFGILIIAFAACISPPDYPVEPQIQFQSLSKNTMRQGQLGTEDSLFLTLSFTDGDGDLGVPETNKDSAKIINIFLTDKRDNKPAERFRLPYIPEQGAGNGISGDIRLLLFTTCCNVLPPCEASTNKPIDTLVYEIYIKDRAGHESNRILTAPIYLQCK